MWEVHPWDTASSLVQMPQAASCISRCRKASGPWLGPHSIPGEPHSVSCRWRRTLFIAWCVSKNADIAELHTPRNPSAPGPRRTFLKGRWGAPGGMGDVRITEGGTGRDAGAMCVPSARPKKSPQIAAIDFGADSGSQKRQPFFAATFRPRRQGNYASTGRAKTRPPAGQKCVHRQGKNASTVRGHGNSVPAVAAFVEPPRCWDVRWPIA